MNSKNLSVVGKTSIQLCAGSRKYCVYYLNERASHTSVKRHFAACLGRQLDPQLRVGVITVVINHTSDVSYSSN